MKNEDKKTIVNNVYGFQFNGCDITNPTFQTIVNGDMQMEANGGGDTSANPGTYEPDYGESPEEPEAPRNEASGAPGAERTEASGAERTEASGAPGEPRNGMPEELATPVARKLLGKLTGAGILDGAFRPVELSLAKKGVLASLLAVKLGIRNPWQVFGALWGVKPETLRTACNKGMSQAKTLDFQDWIKSIIG